MIDEIRKLISKEAEAVSRIPVTDAYARAVDLLVKYVHKGGGKVVASGMGKAGQIAHNIATTLSSTGTAAVFIHSGEAQHGDLGVIQDKDLLLLVSNSGRTREVLELIELARRLVPGIPIIAICGSADSPLAEKATVLLETGGPEEICPLGLTPTASTTVMTVIGDLLVVKLMEKIGFTKEDYARRHHGGYLGEKARIPHNDETA